MKKLLGLLFALFVFLGCGEDKDTEPLFMGVADGRFVDYDYFRYYFNVDDLNHFNKQSISGVEGMDSTWVYGVKNGKSWIGVYNKLSKNLLKEWVGDEIILNPEWKITFRLKYFLKNGNDIIFSVLKAPDFNFSGLYYSNILFCLTSDSKIREIKYPEPYLLYPELWLIGENKLLARYKKENGEIFGLFTLGGDVQVPVVMQNRNGNQETKYLIGFMGEKVWFAECDNNYQLKQEWLGVENFNRNIKYHVGYDEYEEYYVNYLDMGNEDMLKTNWGYAIIPSYQTTAGIKRSDVFFLYKDKVYYYPMKLGWNSKLCNWYDESILVGGSVVLSPEGKLISNFKWEVTDKDEPISYTEVLRTGYNNISRYNLEKDESVWSTNIDRLSNIQFDARITMTVTDKKDKIWKYRCDIVNKDGSKEQFSFQIDIETGKLTYAS